MSWIHDLLGMPQVSVSATADHVELMDHQLVLGLSLTWKNLTKESIFVDDVEVTVYPEGAKQTPRKFRPLESFARLPGQRELQRSPISSFLLTPGEDHMERMRFSSREIADISPGTHSIEVKITAMDKTVYTSKTKLAIETKIKFRRTDEWKNG
jgi:hypothetical protein